MTGTYRRLDFAAELSREMNIPRARALKIVDVSLKTLRNALATHQRVEFRNFGVFELKGVPPKIGRNPSKPNDAQYQIPARHRIRFRPGKPLEEQLNPE